MTRTAGRLRSLDAFRGITVAAMILVNNPAAEGDRYLFLRHAEWNGFLPADLIFPAFLFIAGVAITLSLAARRKAGEPARRTAAKIVSRAAIIFALGLLLNALPYFDWEIVRVPGVLQRIALAYLVAALIAVRWGPRGQGMALGALLLGYWALLALVAVPGHPRGGLDPASNLAAYVDRFLMDGHLAHEEWDPEGLLSSVSSIGSVLAGTLAGHWILARRGPRAGRDRTALGLVAGGAAGVALGLALSAWMPINKGLWSSSFVLLSAGLSSLMLAATYWVVDVLGYETWSLPFLVFGTNPILAYWLSSLIAKVLELVHVTTADGSRVFVETALVNGLFSLVGSRPLASVLYATLYTGAWLALLTPLYRRGVFVKI